MSPVTPPIFFVENLPKYSVKQNEIVSANIAVKNIFTSKKINGAKIKSVDTAAKNIVLRVVYIANALPMPCGLAYGKIPIVTTIIRREIIGAAKIDANAVAWMRDLAESGRIRPLR